MTRKEFLKLFFFGQLGFFSGLGVMALLNLPRRHVPTAVPIGYVSDFPEGSFSIVPEHAVALLRTGRGAAFVSTRCTHLGCTVSVVGRRLECPCHHGAYTLEGKVLSGPPGRDLEWFEGGVTVEGLLFFYPGKVNEEKRYIRL